MPTAMKLWRIEQEKPKAVPRDSLDLEARLEEWLREDIGLVSDDLLVIGEQVSTGYGGAIDLLAIDGAANLVILELKRDKTPRDIVAQTLDYASWVEDLDHEAIEEIASSFFKGQDLEQAFREKFDDDLPDVLNERHRMYIVASSLDPATERIVKYLSETHDVDINVATFAYFKTAEGELLGRSLLLDESEVQQRAEKKSKKRKPPLTWEELRGLAGEQGVADLYDQAFSELDPLFDGKNRTRSNVAFTGLMGEEQSRNALVGVYPGLSSREGGLVMTVYLDRLPEYFGIQEERIRNILGPPAPDAGTVHRDRTFLFDTEHLERFLNLLREAKRQQ